MARAAVCWLLFAALGGACRGRSEPYPAAPSPNRPTSMPVPVAAHAPCESSSLPPAPEQAGDCQPLPASTLAREFAKQLTKRLREQDRRLHVNVSFDCSTVGSDVTSAFGLRGTDHAHDLTVWTLERIESDFKLRALRLVRVVQPELGGRGGDVEYFSRDVPGKSLERAFTYARLALAAKIQAAPPRDGDLQGISIVGSDANAATELKLVGQTGQALKAFYGDAAEIPGATPHLALEMAWESLSPLFVGPFAPRAPEEDDRALLAKVWLEAGTRPRWLEDLLIELSVTLGTSKLLTQILPALDAPYRVTQIRAVHSIASITGWDAIHDAQGRVRELGEIVGDYKRGCKKR
jgi:hypothetical protein